MRHKSSILLAAAAALLAAGCGGDPNLPEATGKGNVRAINAIPTSSDIVFLIEAFDLGSIDYQGATAPDPYDDLSYTFNFEAFYAGDSARRLVASRDVDIVADRDYTFLLTGTLANPSITLLDTEQRSFNDTDTVFAARFAHTSAALGALDYYFADPAVVHEADGG